MIKEYNEYVRAIDVPDELKKKLLTTSELKRAHELYVNLFYFLAPLYPAVESINKLSFAGYLYFRFLLFFDDFIDNVSVLSRRTETSKNLMVGFEFYEKSIRELSSVIPNDDFWKSFSALRQGYFKTIQLEKNISLKKEAFSEDVFNKLAIGKSSMCFATVHALESIGGKTTFANEIIQCLEHIHIAYQYLDDIDDFRKDIAEEQWTYLRYKLSEYLAEKGLGETTDPGIQHKYLYLSGIAEESIRMATVNFGAAIDITKKLGLQNFENYLQGQNDQCIQHLKEIEFLKKKATSKIGKSNLLHKSISVEQAISRGLQYLINNINQDFAWPDFLTSAGEGKNWTTAFVGYNLAQLENTIDILPKVLQSNATKYGRYNDDVLQDGDSTNFFIAFKSAMNQQVLKEEIKGWLRFRNADGGWVTYRDEDKLREFLKISRDVSMSGWMNAQHCVTAVSALVLLQVGDVGKDIYDQTCQYLISHQNAKGYWNSYWWTSPVYATSFSVLAMAANVSAKEHCKKAVQWLVSVQQADGSWKNGAHTTESSALYTALALRAIATFDDDGNLYKDAVDKGFEWLMQNQTEDGSWKSQRVLRIPSPDIENPDLVFHWRKSSFGTNCVVDDHNRFFTTSTVVSTLESIRKLQLVC
jgi:squalene-hopene/tetraprenyl-beta-curcumene cyclase